MNVYDVTFTFEDPGVAPVTVKAVEGESILDICEENNIELHHNCGGVCACSTCHVYIVAGMENLPEISDKEEDFIDRAINPRIESRLGCQCLIGGNVSVLVADQRLLHGH